jgi:hypothetical protein
MMSQLRTAAVVWACDWVALLLLTTAAYAVFALSWCVGIDRHPVMREAWFSLMRQLDETHHALRHRRGRR